ncbi:MAG TPA: VWA domain-containing protein [Xanthomonadaceae bacterium]|nr:VWA domain-containing protein [Xanthomonadaceae bacterium]
MNPSAWLPLHWLRPEWLWALAALPLLAWWWHRRRAAQGVWRELVDPHLLPALLAAPAGTRARLSPVLALLAATLLVCALAGPSWRRDAQPLWQQRAPLVIALDLSSAALAADLPPSRLAQAKAKIARLLEMRAGGQVALVAYAGDAYTVAPLTDDAANVALLLDALAPDVMPLDGSDAASAIAWSARLLEQAGFTRGDILLLTGETGGDAAGAARKAAAAGYRVSVLGLGTAQGAVYRDANGAITRARLEAPTLRALAAAGGGRYATLVAGDADLEALGVLDPRAGAALATGASTTLLWRDQGYWLLLPALLLAAFAFRRGGVFAALLVCAWLPWQPAQASGDWWLRPDQQAHARMEAGVEAYRRGAYDEALASWRDLPGADAAYNRGNALAKAGDYRAAIAAYDQALSLQPGMRDAIANREAVRRALQRKQQGGGGDKQQRGQGQRRQGGKQDKQDQQGRPDPTQQGQDGEARGQPRRRAPEQAGAQPRQALKGERGEQAEASADAAAQQRADAAQRERMRQALQGEQGKAQVPQRARPGETPAERERRLANEAWLRRIPDDPGGLLRARFRLEHERRQQEGE